MSVRFDVFLSHASPDKPLVERIARRLEGEGLRPWLDKWNLIPGDAWQPAIEKALDECAACAVFIGPGGLGNWHHEEMRRAIDRRVGNGGRAFRVIPVLLPGVERPERSRLPGFLVATTWVEFIDSIDDPEEFRRLVCGVRGIEPGAGPGGAALKGRCPYRGLELFDVEHARSFFGREALTEWLLDALKRKPTGAESRFLAIVGASGSGKSSLARAGLLAALKDGRLPGSESWPLAICRPGPEPFTSLATALTAIAPQPVAALVFDRLQGRKDADRSLHVAAGLVLGEPPRAARLVLLVDQFEEVFTLCRDEAARRDLIANLLHAATVAGGRTVVILAMRADFYPRCAAHTDLAAALSDHQILVGPMADEDLRRAIERPALLAGLDPEPGLVELLVGDVRGRPGALPLLQFALQELWRRREANRLTIRAYRDIGQIEGALQRKADAVFAGFTSEQQDRCRRVFLRLVQPGEGSEDTRRRASLGELLPDDPEQAGAVRAIIDRLTDPESRLLTIEGQRMASGEGTLEVVHEALIRGWPRLRNWIEADRAGLRTHRRLTEAAKEWADADAGSREAALYTGARLAVASEWAAAHRDDLGALEGRFLAASQEHGARVARRLRRGAAALGVLLLLSAGLAVAFWGAWGRARRNEETANARARVATSRQVAARAAAERGTRLDRSLLLAVEALRVADTLEARDSLFQGLHDRPGLRAFLHAGKGYAETVAFSHDGKILAVGTSGFGSNMVELWDMVTRKPLARGPLAVGHRVRDVAFSPDRKTFAVAYGDDYHKGHGVALWDVATWTPLPGGPLPTGAIELSLAFSPDGKVLAVGCSGIGSNSVELWDMDTRKPLTGDRHTLYWTGKHVAFSPDGKALAVWEEPGVVLRDLATREQLPGGPLLGKLGQVGSLAFSPDGKTLAEGYNIGPDDGCGVALWDLTKRDQALLAPFRVRAATSIHGVAFSPDGKLLAAGYQTLVSGRQVGGVALWDLSYGQMRSKGGLVVNEGEVTDVAFSPDGTTLAACYRGGVLLWDVSRSDPLASAPLHTESGFVHGLAFSLDGTTLTVGEFPDLSRWDVATRKPLDRWPLIESGTYQDVAAFSPGGAALVIGHGDQTRRVTLLDVPTRRRLADETLGPKQFIRAVALGADGRTFAAGYVDGDASGVGLWDVVGGKPAARGRLPVPEGEIRGVALAPDGTVLAAGYARGGVRGSGVVLWDVSTRRRLGDGPLRVPEGYVGGLAISPDGTTLAAGYGDRFYRGSSGGVVLWDVSTRRRLTNDPLPVRDGGVTGLAFSPDGKTLAASLDSGASRPYGVLLWDVLAREGLVSDRLPAGDDVRTNLAISPDGKTLAVGYSHDVTLWDLDRASWARLAGRIANRNLTLEEWREYFPDTPYRATFPDLTTPP